MSRRSLAGFQWPCASRGTASRKALPWARRSSGGTYCGSESESAVGLFMMMPPLSDRRRARRIYLPDYSTAARSRLILRTT